MRLGVDAMGGDYAPEQAVLGAIDARKVLPAGAEIILFGDKEQILSVIRAAKADENLFPIIHCSEVIGMAEHPTKAIQQKPDSSISKGFELLKSGAIDSFASAGNTGAMLVGAMFSVKAIPGIFRPAIASILPKVKGGWGLILDVGVNADCKAEFLQQFAVLGSVYAQSVYNIESPKVGLLSIGEEEEKGNLLIKEAHQLLKETPDINFIGNVEGRDFFNDKADVVVCDGFTGNVVLKEAESFFDLLKKRGIKDEYFDRFNYEQYGGTSILGVNSPVIIAHGISKATAIKNMILHSADVVNARLPEKIASAFSHAL
jgi:glycerol-3-phosphate acyltransferase PlsX